MSDFYRILPFLSLLVLCTAVCAAQTPARDSSASISGRVTIGGKGVAGITVVVSAMNSSYGDNKPIAKTATDDDGNYRLTGISPGRVMITPIAKAFVPGTGSKPLGKSMLVAEGESITKIDFALVHGGVITGRITDAQGNPIIGEQVSMSFENTPNASRQLITWDGPKNKTDDRGIYRVYGLEAGNYKVSVGQSSSSVGGRDILMGGSPYVKTFYPGVLEESKATIIELKEGAEITGIDITPGKSAEGFSAAGTVVDAESGRPVANVSIAYSSFTEANQPISGMIFTGVRTDTSGKFRFEGIRPGRYAAFSVPYGQDNTTYCEPTPFEISDGDVTGIEIKLRPGGTISGVAVIENNSDPAIAALLKRIVLYAFVHPKGAGAPSMGRGQINPDSSFRLVGLAPGKAIIGIEGFPVPPKGLTIARTELDGVDQEEGIEMAPGAQISGVRVVFSYGSGSMRGEVKIEGGVLPEGTIFHLYMRPGSGDDSKFTPRIDVDARGRFASENISPGTYELSLYAFRPDPGQPEPFKPLKQSITVANDAEVRVVFVVNLAAGKAEPQ